MLHLSQPSLLPSLLIATFIAAFITHRSLHCCLHYSPQPSLLLTKRKMDFPIWRKNMISIADGTLITVAGQGEVQISPSITLKNVLHVPKLSTNLISIQKLTKDLSCNVVFYSNSCILQDKNSGRMIGHAKNGMACTT